jgi:hypothetical protein
LAAVALLASGCTAQRIVAPSAIPPPTAPPDLFDVHLEIKSFEVTNLSTADIERDRSGTAQQGAAKRELERAFFSSLVNSAHYGSISRLEPDQEPSHDAHQLEVQVRVDETSEHTIIFDALFFYPFLGTLPFTPVWGKATVEIRWTLEHAGAREAFRVEVEAPYSMILYAWYRTDEIEAAFKRAHRAAIAEVTERLAHHFAALSPPQASTSSASVILARAEDAPDPSRSAPAGPSMAQTDQPIVLRPEGVGVIAEPLLPESESPSLLKQYFGALGGLEGSITGGVARVDSSAQVAGGDRQTVGSGRATSHGYRVSFYKPPSKTGFFFPPAFGFLSQTIEISGFRQDVPLFTPPGTSVIPAVVSDPSTGLPVDANEPIAYRLKLKSGYIGQQAGLNLVIGNEDVQLFTTLRAGINVFEVRYTDVLIYQTRATGPSVAFFQSAIAGGQIGIYFPGINLALRSAIEYAWYNAFSYPQQLEFQAAVAYNPQKQAFERERVFVNGAGLQTFDWQVSAVYVF